MIKKIGAISILICGLLFAGAVFADTNETSSGGNTTSTSGTSGEGTTSTDTVGSTLGGGVYLVTDTTPPVITILGNNPVYLSIKDTYHEAGAVAYDNTDGDVTLHIQTDGNVHSGQAGTYKVVYRVGDSFGNIAEATRVVYISDTPITTTTDTTSTDTAGNTITTTSSVGTIPPDTTPPIIMIRGGSPVKVALGTVYVDQGAQAKDDRDGDLTGNIEAINSVNTGEVGTYSVFYRVKDHTGNTAQAVRVVYVVRVNDSADDAPLSVPNTDIAPVNQDAIAKPPTESTKVAPLPPERVDDGTVHAPAIVTTHPETDFHMCTTADTCRKLCENTTDLAKCREFVRAQVILPQAAPTPAPVDMTNATPTPQQIAFVEEKKKQNAEILADRTGARAHLDTDGDGITDYDEVNIYHTDPTKRDTNGDGIPDGKEILAMHDPRATSTTPLPIVFQKPADAPEAPTLDVFKVSDIKVSLATSTSAVSSTTPEQVGNSMVFRGTGPANSVLTLYIFSEPIVVTVQTDSEGNWVYNLDQELPDGSHNIYVGVTNGEGQVVAKGTPIPFIKTAQAVSFGGGVLPVAPSSPSLWSLQYVGLAGILVIGVLGLAFIMLGSRKSSEEIPVENIEDSSQ